MRVLLRLVCVVRGHVNAAEMLPEEAFGLYAYSRLFCSRCDTTFEERSIEDQIEVLMGYVTLWNDVRPIVEAAQWVANSTGESGPHIDLLIAAVERYEKLYPEHKRAAA